MADVSDVGIKKINSLDTVKEKLKELIHTEKPTSNSKRIAEYLSVYIDRIAFKTAAQVAEDVGVSQSAITRLTTNNLGLNGFTELRNMVRDSIRHEITGTERYLMSHNNMESKLERIILEEIELLKKLLEETSPEVLKHIASQVSMAETVFISGLRTAAPIASYFHFFLSKIHRNVLVDTHGGGGVFEKIYKLDPVKTVYVLFIFPRYPREMIEIIQCIKKTRSTMFTVTDSRVLQTSGICECNLITPISMTTLFDSHTTALCLSNLLIDYIGRANQRQTQSMLDNLEKLFKAKQIFYDFHS